MDNNDREDISVADQKTIGIEVDEFFARRLTVLDQIDEEAQKCAQKPEGTLELLGMGLEIPQDCLCRSLIHNVADIQAFSDEMRERGHTEWVLWNDRSELLRREMEANGDALSVSGGANRISDGTLRNKETGQIIPALMTDVVYQSDHEVLTAFFVGHEEGHILHSLDCLSWLYACWTQGLQCLEHHECLELKEEDIADLINKASDADNPKGDTLVTETLAHLGGLYSAFLRYDPQVAGPIISPGTDSDEFRWVIEMIGYKGPYCLGSSWTRRNRARVYGWNESEGDLLKGNWSDMSAEQAGDCEH